MRPRTKSLLMEKVREVQISKRSPVEASDLIGKTPLKDPGRALRRLYEEGKLYRTPDGRYYLKSLKRMNSLGRF